MLTVSHLKPTYALPYFVFVLESTLHFAMHELPCIILCVSSISVSGDIDRLLASSLGYSQFMLRECNVRSFSPPKIFGLPLCRIIVLCPYGESLGTVFHFPFLAPIFFILSPPFVKRLTTVLASAQGGGSLLNRIDFLPCSIPEPLVVFHVSERLCVSPLMPCFRPDKR